MSESPYDAGAVFRVPPGGGDPVRVTSVRERFGGGPQPPSYREQFVMHMACAMSRRLHDLRNEALFTASMSITLDTPEDQRLALLAAAKASAYRQWVSEVHDAVDAILGGVK